MPEDFDEFAVDELDMIDAYLNAEAEDRAYGLSSLELLDAIASDYPLPLPNNPKTQYDSKLEQAQELGLEDFLKVK